MPFALCGLLVEGGMKMKMNKKAWHPIRGDQVFLFKLEPLNPGILFAIRFAEMQDSEYRSELIEEGCDIAILQA